MKALSFFENKQLSHKAVYIISAIIAALIFFLIYGVSIINPTYDSWLYNSAGDFAQHYIGWLFYRRTQWSFPIGLLEGVAYPDAFSVIYMDSIPIFALFFKILSPLLPETFQYFGIYGLITFVLQGVLGASIVYSKTKDEIYSLLASVFFALSTTVLQRMYTHSALAFHPIVLMAIYLYMNKEAIVQKKRDVMYWTLLSVLAVSVHIYFLPMMLAFIVAFYLPSLISRKWYLAICRISAPMIMALISMFAWGYFYGDQTINGGGLGNYNCNLNALFNSKGTSLIAKLMSITSIDGIWEGYAYLGVGIIVLSFIVVYDLIYTRKIKGLSRRHIPSALLVVVFVFFATYPIIRLGPYTLFTIPLPSILQRIAGVFRANGRFMWPVMYLIIASTVIYLHRNFKYKYIILEICLLIQILDLSVECKDINTYMNTLVQKEDLLVDECWDVLSYKNEIYFIYNPVGGGDINATMSLGKYAYDNDMVMNDFYIARKNSENINSRKGEEQSRVFERNPDDGKIYIFDKLSPDYLLYDTGLNIYKIDGIYVGVTDELDDKEKMSVQNGINLLEYSTRASDTARINSQETIETSVTLPIGTYHIQIDGDNLDSVYIELYLDEEHVDILEDCFISDEEIGFDLYVDEEFSGVEIKLVNEGLGEVLVDNMKLTGDLSRQTPLVGYTSKYKYGSVLRFQKAYYNVAPYVQGGLGGAETKHTWTVGHETSFRFELEEVAEIVTAEIEVLGVFNGAQNVYIYVGDTLSYAGVVSGSGVISFDFDYPEDSVVDMRIVLPDAISPVEVGQSLDSRTLGLMLDKMQMKKTK